MQRDLRVDERGRVQLPNLDNDCRCLIRSLTDLGLDPDPELWDDTSIAWTTQLWSLGGHKPERLRPPNGGVLRTD
jgi:hypothetical protein